MTKNFDLDARLAPVYSTYPEASHRPLIGLTANFADGNAMLRNHYYEQVVAAGGVPVIIPPVTDKDVIINTLDQIDGLLLTGGGDYNPLWAGEQPSPHLHGINAKRDLAELLLTRLAYNRQIPMLGICRGIQTLALALGGKVMQDIAENRADELKKDSETHPLTNSKTQKLIKHSQEADNSEPTHTVKIEVDSTLYNIYQRHEIYVNSLHHQAVSDAGKRFRVTATAHRK